MGHRQDIIRLYNSTEFQQLKAYYAKRSALDIFGVARDELAHSNMLAWLLDPSETHGLGLFPVRKFLHLLVMAKLELSINSDENAAATFDRDLMDAILTNVCIIKSAEVKTEVAVDSTGDKRRDSRIDILILLTLVLSSKEIILPIVVENKVNSCEHNNQTIAYYNWGIEFSLKNHFLTPLFVFLTPEKTFVLNQETEEHPIPCACKNYIRINYQYIVNHVLEPCLNQNLSEEIRFMLSGYLRSLTYIFINGDIKEGDTYMALGGEERALLTQFWENNKNLLSAVLSAVADDPDNGLENNERLDIRKAVGTLSKRDYTKYKIEGVDGVLAKNRMVLAAVRKYVIDHEGITFEELLNVFPDSLQGSFGVIKRENERKGNGNIRRYFEGEDEIIRLDDGTNVYVSTEWGKGNVEKFIQAAKNNGIQIKEA
jgi:hypothetical protein